MGIGISTTRTERAFDKRNKLREKFEKKNAKAITQLETEIEALEEKRELIEDKVAKIDATIDKKYKKILNLSGGEKTAHRRGFCV